MGFVTANLDLTFRRLHLFNGKRFKPNRQRFAGMFCKCLRMSFLRPSKLISRLFVPVFKRPRKAVTCNRTSKTCKKRTTQNLHNYLAITFFSIFSTYFCIFNILFSIFYKKFICNMWALFANLDCIRMLQKGNIFPTFCKEAKTYLL